jgi:hypothetical protein
MRPILFYLSALSTVKKTDFVLFPIPVTYSKTFFNNPKISFLECARP